MRLEVVSEVVLRIIDDVGVDVGQIKAQLVRPFESLLPVLAGEDEKKRLRNLHLCDVL
jgi:hypothetical protein